MMSSRPWLLSLKQMSPMFYEHFAFVRLSNDISNIFFLTNDIWLNNLSLTFYRHEVKVWIEGTVSQIFFVSPIFCFMKSRKKCLKNTLKVSRFFK